jgi:hypothetical protein
VCITHSCRIVLTFHARVRLHVAAHWHLPLPLALSSHRITITISPRIPLRVARRVVPMRCHVLPLHLTHVLHMCCPSISPTLSCRLRVPILTHLPHSPTHYPLVLLTDALPFASPTHPAYLTCPSHPRRRRRHRLPFASPTRCSLTHVWPLEFPYVWL